MIFDLIFFSRLTSASHSLLPKASERTSGAVSGYIIDNTGPPAADLFHSPSVFKANNRFCIALQAGILAGGSAQNINDLIEFLGPVYFNPHSFTLNGHPLIFLVTPSGDKNQDVRPEQVARQGENAGQEQEKIENVLRILFTHLGYDKFYFCCFTDQQDPRIIYTNIEYNITLFNKTTGTDTRDLENWYSNLLEQGHVSQKLLLIQKEPDVSSLAVTSAIERVEAEFKKKDPSLFALLNENAKLLEQNEEYNIRMHELELDVESKSQYIKNTGVQESTLKKIADFYNNEYEILPMWYKQIGHIIKVLMGKRSFRSLYDDKVKKYKD